MGISDLEFPFQIKQAIGLKLVVPYKIYPDSYGKTVVCLLKGYLTNRRKSLRCKKISKSIQYSVLSS